MTVIGDPVNTASRIQQAAEPGVLTLSEATLSRLKNSAEFAFRRKMPLKGKDQPVSVFELRSKA